MDRVTVRPSRVPSTGKPYSPGVRYRDLLFVSGQVAYDPASGKAMEGGFEVQARRTLDNLAAVLDAGGSSLQDVLKTTCFLTDIGNVDAFNTIYREYFPGDEPARSTFEVSSLSSGFLVEVEAIAAVSSPETH